MAAKKSTMSKARTAVRRAAKKVGKALGLTGGKKKSGAKKSSARRKTAKKK